MRLDTCVLMLFWGRMWCTFNNPKMYSRRSIYNVSMHSICIVNMDIYIYMEHFTAPKCFISFSLALAFSSNTQHFHHVHICEDMFPHQIILKNVYKHTTL